MSDVYFYLVLGAVLLSLFAAMCLWQRPGALTGKITAEELRGYLARVEQLPLPEEQRRVMLERLRHWGETDDGRPLFMVNMMRFYKTLQTYPGAPEDDLSPEASNQLYEEAALPMVLKAGNYPVAAGKVQAANISTTAPEADHWGRFILMRYPSRRAFFKLITHPEYAQHVAYKFMALEVNLVPVETEVYLPDPRLLLGFFFLILFLAMGWFRAAGGL